jgi:PAS domain S-box-containing protein
MVAGRLSSFQLENRYQRADGSVMWGRLDISAVRDDSDAVVLTVGIVEDITARKQYQAELQAQTAALAQTTARTRAILDSAVDGIVTIDERGIIDSVNPATERLFGYSARELVGQNVKILMPQPYRDEHDGYIERYRRTGERRIIGIGREVVGQRKDGSVFPVDLAVSEVPLGGRRLFLGTIRDITARKQLEDQLRQALKIEAIGRLAGGVAHDFNNLLASILGYSEQLASELPEGPLRRAAQQIRRSAERGAGLTRQLLAFSRRQELAPERLDVGAVLGELHDMLARLLGEHVELEYRIADRLWLVLADRGQLQQVVLNLVVNSRDALGEHGCIRIGADNVEVGDEPPRGGAVAAGRWVRLQVVDNGCGMSAEVKSRIFEPFFTTKELGKGTGLGLSTVFGIVQQSGGSILVQSEPGVGTTFEIYLPATEGELARAGQEEAEPARAGEASETVLLVEDDATFRELLADVLQQTGYRVLVAAHPGEALALAAPAGERIDLLVSDLSMPVMKGTDLARRLTAQRPQLKVLLMSGYAELDDAAAVAAEIGAAFLAKPFRTRELLNAARRLLEPPP